MLDTSIDGPQPVLHKADLPVVESAERIDAAVRTEHHIGVEIGKPLLYAAVRQRPVSLFPEPPAVRRTAVYSHRPGSTFPYFAAAHIFIKIFTAVAAFIQLVKRDPYVFPGIKRIRQPVQATGSETSVSNRLGTQDFL